MEPIFGLDDGGIWELGSLLWLMRCLLRQIEFYVLTF